MTKALVSSVCLVSISQSTAAQIPPDGTVTLTDGGLYFVQMEPYSDGVPYAKLNIGALHHPGGGNLPYDAEFIEITAPYSNPMVVDVAQSCRRLSGRVIGCHVQYPLSTKDMQASSVTLTGRYYIKDNAASYEAAVKRSSPVTGEAGSEGRPEASIDITGNRPPIANAGEDVTTNLTSLFWLDGRGSSDPDGDTLTYKWEQVSGHPVDLGQPTGAMAMFWPPGFPSPRARTFRLTVTDYHGHVSAPDDVTITHEPRPTAPSCPVWGRDDLVASLTPSQPGGSGSNFGIRLELDPAKTAVLQSEADRLGQLYPDFKTLEIKITASKTSGGNVMGRTITVDPVSPEIPGASSLSLRFETPVSPAPQVIWSGEPFEGFQSYQIKTEVKLYGDNDQALNTSIYPGECESAEVYVHMAPMAGRIIGGTGFPIRAPLFVITDGEELLASRDVDDFPKPQSRNYDPGRGGRNVPKSTRMHVIK